MKTFFTLFVLGSFLVAPLGAKADENSGKEFMTSVIYGTVAGTLVGAATLAFTDNPGDNLGNIARGASLGLYAGILLGFYVSSGPGESADREGHQEPVDEVPKDTTVTPDNPSSSTSPTPNGSLTPVVTKQEPLYGFSVFPLIDHHNLGFGANLIRLHF